MNRYEDAEQAYRNLIKLDKGNAWAWGRLGDLLHEKLGRYQEAEQAYRKAIEIDPTMTFPAYGLLVQLLQDKLGRSEEALDFAESSIARYPEEPALLNNLAWAFYKTGPESLLEKAEAWARKAVQIRPDAMDFVHTLVCILIRQEKRAKALQLAEKHLDNVEVVNKSVDYVTQIFTELAAAGSGREALEILRNSPSADILEPLVVGLRLFLGEDVKVAAEILEVGKDVYKRIQQRRDEIQAQTEANNIPDKG